MLVQLELCCFINNVVLGEFLLIVNNFPFLKDPVDEAKESASSSNSATDLLKQGAGEWDE